MLLDCSAVLSERGQIALNLLKASQPIGPLFGGLIVARGHLDQLLKLCSQAVPLRRNFGQGSKRIWFAMKIGDQTLARTSLVIPVGEVGVAHLRSVNDLACPTPSAPLFPAGTAGLFSRNQSP